MSAEIVTTDKKPWDIFKNSFEVLYPTKLDLVIGGYQFTQYELGWVELMHLYPKIIEITNRALAIGVLNDLDMLAMQEDLFGGLSHMFIRIMDRSRWYTQSRFVGKGVLPFIASVLGRHSPAMCVNTPIYGMILRTDKLDIIDKYLTPEIAAQIQVAFLQQNDIKMIVDNLRSQEDVDKDAPTLGLYQSYIEMIKDGIEIRNDWSPRRVDLIRDVFYRIKRTKRIEEQRTNTVNRLLHMWATVPTKTSDATREHKLRLTHWEFDAHVKEAMYGGSQDNKDDDEWGDGLDGGK